jgi:hypothetical protein
VRASAQEAIMNESFFRKLLNSILDRRGRADSMTKFAAVIAGATACALAMAPMFYSSERVESGQRAAAIHAAADGNEAGRLPPQSKPDAQGVPFDQVQAY